jgi:hypothetical protein
VDAHVDYFCANRATSAEAAGVDSASMTSYIATGGRFPVLMITCDRHVMLEKSLAALLTVRCVRKDDVYVVQDGNFQPVTDVLSTCRRSCRARVRSLLRGRTGARLLLLRSCHRVTLASVYRAPWA